MIITGAVLPAFQVQLNGVLVAPYVFSLGVVALLVGRYMQPVQGNDLRIKRLRFQQFIGACLLVASAYLMFVGDNKWVIALLLFAVIELVVLYRTPKQ